VSPGLNPVPDIVTISPFFKFSAGLTISTGLVFALAVLTPMRPPAKMLAAMTTAPTAILKLRTPVMMFLLVRSISVTPHSRFPTDDKRKFENGFRSFLPLFGRTFERLADIDTLQREVRAETTYELTKDYSVARG